MVLVAQSGFRSTGDRVPRNTLPNNITTLNRITKSSSRSSSKRPRLANDDDWSEGDNDNDIDVYDPGNDGSSPISPTTLLPTAERTIQTRSGRVPPPPAEKTEVSLYI
jgi:hypothetical protein